jgi:CRP-like cAMP-binding protein
MKTDIAEAVLSVLVEAEMFPGIARDDLAFLTQQGELRAFHAGIQLTRQGDVSRSLHIIMGGCVRIERFHPDVADPVVLAILGPGEVVVGAEVLGGQLRSTSVTAIEYTETLELDVRALAQAVLRYPELSAALLHGLSHCTPRANGRTEAISDTLSKTFPSDCGAAHQNMPGGQASDDDLAIDGEAARTGVVARW